MPTLTDEIKTFIVRGLACFDTPSQVAEDVKANFGIEVSRQQVYTYDPAGSQPPAQRWRDLHAVTRGKYLRDVAEIGIAQKVVRLRLLDRMAHRAATRSIKLTAALLAQAAKECGGAYETRRPPVTQRNAITAPAPSVPGSPSVAGPAASGTCGRLP